MHTAMIIPVALLLAGAAACLLLRRATGTGALPPAASTAPETVRQPHSAQQGTTPAAP
ncbi:MAG TPA: hypothetical protein VKS82_05615 [Streptosporangiaceae bacterium]|nr:hypothetical protein [Streptosporangiaceae bacterium]